MDTGKPSLDFSSFTKSLGNRDSIPGPTSKRHKIPIFIMKAMHWVLYPYANRKSFLVHILEHTLYVQNHRASAIVKLSLWGDSCNFINSDAFNCYIVLWHTTIWCYVTRLRTRPSGHVCNASCVFPRRMLPQLRCSPGLSENYMDQMTEPIVSEVVSDGTCWYMYIQVDKSAAFVLGPNMS